MRWEKGQSGNPGGRRKGVHRVEELARTYTEHAVKVLIMIAADSKQPAGARVNAATALLDRGWGRPAQHVEMNATFRTDPQELSDADLAAIVAAGSSESASETQEDSSQLH